MYEEKTYENIMAEMMAEMPDGVNTREGSLIWNACAKQALQLEEAYLELQTVEDNMYMDTQDEEHLIQNGADRGIYIKEATNAIVKAVFSQQIEEGVRFTANDLNYVVLEEISDQSYRLKCEECGEEGNIGSGELIPIDFVEDYKGGNIVEVLVQGQKQEDKELYRKRIKDSVNARYFGGNRQDYERFIEKLEGVGVCKVKRRTEEDKFIYPYILDSNWNVPTAALVESVQEAVDPEQNHGEGDGIAPIGHFVSIKPASGVTVDVNVKFTFDDGYSQESVQSYLENVLEEYFLELKKTWKNKEIIVRISQIEHRLLNVEGVIDIADTKINGMYDNIMLEYAEVPVRGKSMEFEIPAVVEQIKDIKAIYDMNDKINSVVDAENLEKDLFTGTATRRGIARREKLYEIIPADTDTLEDRRFRVLAKENDRIPYTSRTLKEKLETLCGTGGYSLSITESSVEIKVALTRKTMLQDVMDMAENMIPLNMSLNCGLLYNQHKTIGKFTHRQLAAYTHNQIRNEVLSHGN